jgi:transcriptional regulator with XRE-family HTH domain
MSIVFENIRKCRNNKNFTQDYMASQLNVSREWYGKLENGQSDITMKQLEKIAEVLDTTIEEFWASNSVRHFTNNEKWKYYEADGQVNELKKLYVQIIADKDKEISFLRELLKKQSIED